MFLVIIVRFQREIPVIPRAEITDKCFPRFKSTRIVFQRRKHQALFIRLFFFFVANPPRRRRPPAIPSAGIELKPKPSLPRRFTYFSLTFIRGKKRKKRVISSSTSIRFLSSLSPRSSATACCVLFYARETSTTVRRRERSHVSYSSSPTRDRFFFQRLFIRS